MQAVKRLTRVLPRLGSPMDALPQGGPALPAWLRRLRLWTGGRSSIPQQQAQQLSTAQPRIGNLTCAVGQRPGLADMKKVSRVSKQARITVLAPDSRHQADCDLKPHSLAQDRAMSAISGMAAKRSRGVRSGTIHRREVIELVNHTARVCRNDCGYRDGELRAYGTDDRKGPAPEYSSDAWG